jgi:hypothetical protein
MSEKVLKLLKTAEEVVKKIDLHLDKVIKLSTNANMHLEFGTEGTKAVYQVIVAMQKKGAKGDKIGDYKNTDIPKFVKGIQEAKTRLTGAIKDNNAAVVQAGQFLKLVNVLDTQVGELAKDKAIATNGAAIKLLIETRKSLMSMQGGLDDVAKFGKISENQPKFIDVTEKTKIDELKAKLPMAFQAAMKEWEQAGAKIDNSRRAIRHCDFNSGMKLATELAG